MIPIEIYYQIRWHAIEDDKWITAPRVPQCDTIEEALCYLDLIRMGKWRKSVSADAVIHRDFINPNLDYKIFKITTLREVVEE